MFQINHATLKDFSRLHLINIGYGLTMDYAPPYSLKSKLIGPPAVLIYYHSVATNVTDHAQAPILTEHERHLSPALSKRQIEVDNTLHKSS